MAHADNSIPISIPYFVHHGIIFVPMSVRIFGCTLHIVSFDRLSQYATPEPSNLDEIVGPSAYGAATIAGSDGSRQPVAADLSASKFQGKHFSTIVNAYVAGKAASGN